MALFPKGGKSVSRSHASTDASSSVPPPLPPWRLRLAHTSLPMQDYNGNPSCLLAPKFLTHWGFPASPPCLVVTSGLATRMTWTQSLLCLLAAILWWCLLKSLPTSLSVWFLLLPFTFNVIAAFISFKMAPNVRHMHYRVRKGRCSRSYVSDCYFSAAESSARGGGQEAFYCSQPSPVALRLLFRTPQVVGRTKTLPRSCAVRSLLPGVQEPSFPSCLSKTRLHLGPDGCHNVSPLGIYLLFPGWPLKIGAGSGGIVLTTHTLQPLFPRRRAAGSLPGQHCNFINSGSEKPIFIMLIRRAHI